MRFLTAIAGAVLLATACYSQTFGSITGEVRDASGALIPDAAVVVTNTSTSAARSITTNSDGIFNAPSLTPGPYSVRVERPGFRTAQSNIDLQVQQVARVDFELQVGAVGQSVDVSAAPPALNTEDATVGTVIETRRITDLPLNGRNYLQLIALSPNVNAGFASPGQATNRQGGSRATQNFSIMGQRGTFNRYSLDGIENTDVNFNLYVMLPSVDALQEFKVQTGVYPAEFGREAGQINVSTKPGTNQYHGALFEFLRNDKLDAKQYDFRGLNAPRNPFKWNQYGFTLGGPVWIPKVFNGKDRLFFMANYEGYRVRQSNNTVFSVATDQARSGDFSYLLPGNQLYDPASKSLVNGRASGTPLPGNIVPVSRFDPVTQRLYEFLPRPNLPGRANNYQTALGNPINKDQFTIRGDFNESSASTWFGRYSWTDENSLSQGIYLNGSTVITKASQYMISNARVFSPTKVNEFRFGVNVFRNDAGIELAGVRNVVGELGIAGLSTPNPALWGIPRITQLAGISTFGNDSSGPFLLRDAVFQVMDNFSWTAGKHSIRFGGEFRRDRYNQNGNEFARGSFEFNGRATNNPFTNTGGESLADFLLGYCSRCEAAVSLAFAQFRSSSQYYYIDDSWRITPKLTLNAGVRYELTQPWRDQSQKVSNVYEPLFPSTANVRDPALQPVLVRPGNGDFYQGVSIRYSPPILVARDSRLGGDRLVHTNFLNFAPRFGLAYSPNGKWSMRAGFGMFYSQDAANTRFDLARNFGGRITRNADQNVPNIKIENFIGTSGGNTVTLPVGGQVQAIAPNLPTTYNMQYLFNLQRQLGGSTVLEVGYDGNQSKHLGGLQNRNAPIPGIIGNTNSRSPFPQFGIIQTLVNEGIGNYNALGVKVTRRLTNGLTYLASYTWSKALDTTSANRGTNNDILPQDSRCLRCEYSYSAFHTPQRFVISPLYELPFGRGKRWLNRGGWVNQLAGGWQVGSLITWQSGRTLNTNAGSDIPGTGGFGEPRLNATLTDPNLASDRRSTNAWYNVAGFALPAPGNFGSMSRNRLIGPSIITWDFSAFKSFAIREGQQLMFRFESFNFANHPNWGDPNLNWGSTNPARPGSQFLTINSTNTSMRQLQLALKYLF